MSGITAKSAYGKQDENSKKIEPFFITGQPIGSNRYALDALSLMAYEVASAQTAGAGSTTSVINLVGHPAKVGDLIVFNSGSQDEFEVHVLKVIDADYFELGAICSASLVGATFDILRPKTPRVDASGATLATITPAPVQFMYDGAAVDVEYDSVTPANNRALPVQLVNTTGPINITAGDLNVQLSHSVVQYDSVRIGDGTELLAINATNEALTHDEDVLTELLALDVLLTSIDGELGTISGNIASLSDALVSVGGDSLKVTVDSLPAGLATSAKQDTQTTELQSINTELDSQTVLLTSIAGEDFATDTTLVGISNKFNSLGQKSAALSAPFVLSTEQEAILSAIKTAVELLDNTVNGSDQLKVDLVANTIGISTEATLSAMSAKLPASLGIKTAANSLSVAPASDAEFTTVEKPKTVTYSENTAIGSGGATTISAPANAKTCMIYAPDANVASLRIRLAGTATTTSGIQLQPGRSETFPFAADVSVIAESGSNQQINIHWGV